MRAAPVVIQVTRYRCPFCTRARAKKTNAEAHIARCWHNPDARACKTCIHYEPADPNGPYPEHPGWPESCAAEHSLTGGIRSSCPDHKTQEDTA
jgi:hypothetical protein